MSAGTPMEGVALAVAGLAEAARAEAARAKAARAQAAKAKAARAQTARAQAARGATLVAVAVTAVAGCAPDGDATRSTADGGPAPSTADREAARRAAGAGDWNTLRSFREARRLVERSLEALGGPDALDRAGGLALDGEGHLDLGTLLQGRRPFEGDIHAIHERVAVLPGLDRLVHELRSPLNPDALSWRRDDFRPDGTYRIDMATGRATWSRPGSRRRVERLIPHFLLAEVLEAPAGLRHLGTVRVAGEAREAVSWSAPDRGLVTLLFDASTGLLREVEALADLPVRGDSWIRFGFHEYAGVPGLGPFPAGYSIHVNGERLQEIRWTRRDAAPEGGVLDPPDGVSLPEPTPFPPEEEDEPFDIRELDPGVHLLVNLRTGFHVLFVEFEEWIVAVDAPAGWWELQELPPRDWAGSASPELGERYVEGIRSRLGDKPIRYVVLTHHHSDHAGGVRAFVEAGATVLGARETRPVVERTLAGTLELASRAQSSPPPLRFEAVDGERTLSDGSMEMRILDVGGNPHSEGMLAVWLPGRRILYVSDLFDPWSAQGSPPAQRLPVMRWFVDWLDGSGLDPDRIYAIHGAALVTAEHLDEIRRLRDAGA